MKLKIRWDTLDVSFDNAIDFNNDWSLLTIKMDFDSVLGHITASALRNGIEIIAPTGVVGIPYLDKPDSIHKIGANIPSLNFFNGFIKDFEIHNIVLP